MEDDRSYFLRRASEERAAAEKAAGMAREAHAELARLYDERAGASRNDGRAAIAETAPRENAAV
ncbi:MAG TPA: hypothetical protein VFU80_07255 [Sphingomicrobium sp.]|nr:hypothetical protein [Sphingomicrobium sp.]